MRRDYVTRRRVAELKDHLSERDRSVLDSVARLRLVTGGQLQRLHFQDLDGSKASRARHRRRVLTKLTDLRLLARLPRQIGGVRAGSSGHVYSLDVGGQRLSDLSAVIWRPRPPWVPSPIFLRHRLAVSEVYVGLVEAERAGTCQLLEFLSEPACWRRFQNLAGQAVVLKPDAFFRLGAGDYEYLWFLELDRGHESPWTLRRKCERYQDYWLSGQEERRYGIFPATLWSVPDRDRAEVVRSVIKRLRDKGPSLFRVACTPQTIQALTAATTDSDEVRC